MYAYLPEAKMKDMQAYCPESDFFRAEVHDQICTLELKNCSMLAAIDLKCRDEVIDFLDSISKNSAIKVVMMISHHSTSCCEDYVAFYDRVYQSKLSKGDFLRACRTLDQIMLKIVSSPKFFISVNSGKLFPEAFCWDLACDYRIISEYTSFQNACLEYEIMPKGGAIYFLEKCIGRGKTTELLFSDVPIEADQALSLGFVNKVVSRRRLETAAWEAAQYYARQPAVSIAGIKMMQNYFDADLKEYLEFETQAIVRALRKNFHPSCDGG